MGIHISKFTPNTANMLIFKDILTGDEIVSDSYDPKLVDNVVYEVDCAMVTEGALDDAEVKVNNVVNSFRLQSTVFDKKSYLSHLKGYMKAVKAKLTEKGASPETIAEFEKGAQTYVKEKLLPNFKDFEFYTGESQDVDGMVVLLNYREDGVTPYIIAWKHGLEGMKV